MSDLLEEYKLKLAMTQRALDTQDFTNSNLHSWSDHPRADKIADRLLQRWLLSGFAVFKRNGGKRVWSLTAEGRPNLQMEVVSLEEYIAAKEAGE